MNPISIVRKQVFADFSHTTVAPRLPESQTGRIMHEVTLRNQVARRLSETERLRFEKDAAAGWALSQELKKQKADPSDIYMAWLRPFSKILTENDIRNDILTNWVINDNFGWVVREIANRMGYSKEDKMPLTFVSGAITPMIAIAMGMFYKDLASEVVDLKINALDIKMEQGIFTGELGPIDPRIYLGATSYTGDYLIVGDHYMRNNPLFGNHLITIFEPDGTCYLETVKAQLDLHFPK